MLLEYLQDYTDRVKPLQDQNELFGKIQSEFEKKWENGTFLDGRWASVGVWVEDIQGVNYFTLILSLCFRPSDAGPLGSVVARRCSLPSMLSFLCILWKEICQGHLPLAEPSIFTNTLSLLLCGSYWPKADIIMCFRNLYYIFSFLGTNMNFSEISGRIGPSGFSWCVFFSFLLCS